MYGRFKTKELQQFAKDQAARLRHEQKLEKEKQQHETDDIFHTYDGNLPGPFKSKLFLIVHHHQSNFDLGLSP